MSSENPKTHGPFSWESPPVIPEKGPRPRAWDKSTHRYQWHFKTIPTTIRVDGQAIESPFRKVAIYVVHGIGEQVLGETAAGFRVALEDAVTRTEPRNWAPDGRNAWIVPQPYLFDGYWGDYDDLEAYAPDVVRDLADEPLEYFKRVWRGRAVSLSRTAGWFAGAGARLIAKARGFARLYYLLLVPMLWATIGIMAILPKTRKIITRYLNDVRVYVEPRGDVQREIVQRIDRRVADKYLRLIGLTWELEEIPEHQLRKISGGPHRFDHVVWVAHSLGTVISYNVIGDLLHLCRLKRRENASGEHPGADRLEQSLRAFVTLGSPLDKMVYLFGTDGGEVLRPWPEEYLPGGGRSLWTDKHPFWQNFYYTGDPVAGSLDEFEDGAGGRVVTNLYTRRSRFYQLRLPGVAHVNYWRDPYILDRVIRLAYGEYVCEKPMPTVGRLRERLRLRAMSLAWLILLAASLSAVLYYAYLRVVALL